LIGGQRKGGTREIAGRSVTPRVPVGPLIERGRGAVTKTEQKVSVKKNEGLVSSPLRELREGREARLGANFLPEP